MPASRNYDSLRVRSCADCCRTVVTAQELANKSIAFVPKGMKLYAGSYWGRPYCANCLPAGSKGVRK